MTCSGGLERLFKVMLPEWKRFLNDNRTYLKHQSFGCTTDNGQIVAFATVDRNKEKFIGDPPVVMLQVLGDEAFRTVLYASKVSNNMEFLLVDTAFFAYEPILKCLQEMAGIPLANDLLV